LEGKLSIGGQPSPAIPMTIAVAPSRFTPPGVLALAPMDGVTDSAYRELWTSKRAGSTLAFCVSEFVRVSDRPLPDLVLERTCPELKRGGVTRGGVPVLLQLLGGDPEPLAQTARRAIHLGAFGIDLNFGCPAKLVNRHDGGAALLRAPERIERIVSAVRARVPLDRPVSVKIRLGWESHDEVVPIALAAERGGASWLTIHGRTKTEMYGPPADWAAIGRARAAVGCPVVANGDLNTAALLKECGSVSGCDFFMLGRGPMGRPSLLRPANTEEPTHGPSEAAEQRALFVLLLDYLEELARADNSEARQVSRVKQWLSLGTRVNPGLRPHFEHVKHLERRSDLQRHLAAN
jgi:tRNA-dihydrouridine synthase C